MAQAQPILITGGTGFIGSHTAVVLAEAGQPVVILDNLCNSSPKVLDRLARLNASPLEFVFMLGFADEAAYQQYADAPFHLAMAPLGWACLDGEPTIEFLRPATK